MNISSLDLTKQCPRSPRETLAGYIIICRTLDKCRATIAGTNGEYHYDCPLDNVFFDFTGISADQFKDFVATGANDDAVAKWIEKTAVPRPQIEVIKWNNEWRYKRISEMADPLQEFLEGYIPQVIPPGRRPAYWFDVYDIEEKRL
jgi:hypothetical protein